MNKKTLGYILAVTGLIIIALGLFTYTYSATVTQTETLQPLGSKIVQLELAPGDKVQGALTVLDGDEGITVYIENPRGEASYNGGTVYDTVDFSFNTQTAGKHTAIFTNISPSSTQTIEYSFTYPVMPSLASLAIIVIGAFLVLIGVTFMVILHKAKLLQSKKRAATP
jgi:uncharacterized membrane protein